MPDRYDLVYGFKHKREDEMSDTFRKVYKPLNERNAQLVTAIKQKAEELEALMLLVKSREMSLALTNLEQSTMWATKAIVLEDEKNGGIEIAA